MFQEALQAIEKGERARARDLLTRLLKADPNQAEYWLWMSAVVESRKERIYCLKETLRLDPQNVAAKRGLIMLGQLPPDPKLVVPLQSQRRNWENTLPKIKSREMPKPPLSFRQVFLFGSAFVVFVATIVFAVISTRPQKEAPVAERPLFPATATEAPAPTFGYSTAAMTPVGPTPLWMFLQATYTPTPLYVNTPHISEAYNTALRALGRGQYDQMALYLDQAITLQPQAADLFYYKGEAYRLQGKYSQANEFYKQALALNPEFAPAYLGQARVAMAVSPDNAQSAQSSLQKALQLDPQLYEARLELAVLALWRGDGEKALAELEEVSRQMPDAVLLYYYRARAYLLTGELERALQDAERANQMDITFLGGYRLVGEIAMLLGDTEKALSALSTYLTYQPDDAQALAWLGAVYAAGGQLDQAFQMFDQALQKDSRSFEAYFQRGRLYLSQNNLDAALADLSKAVQLNGRSYPARIALGRVYLLKEEDRSAYQQFASAEGLAQNDAERAGVYYWRAQALERIGESRAAIRDWQALLDLPEKVMPAEWRTMAEEKLQILITPTMTKVPTRTRPPTDTRVPTRTPVPTNTRQPSATWTPTRTVTLTRTLPTSSTP
jgi:tetratricopeptide (TPR) repeat protein